MGTCRGGGGSGGSSRAPTAACILPSPSRAAAGRAPRATIVAGAAEKGAVCLDGTPPGYDLPRGSGDGSNSWIIHLQRGGWCSTVKECSDRSKTDLGSSSFMGPVMFAYPGI